MNIGLDIDNVITAFDKKILKEFIKEDKNKRNAGIINKKAQHIVHGMFDWSKDEVDEFFAKNMESFAKVLKPRRGSKKYMEKLISDGHKLILISHRVYPHYKEAEKTTINWLYEYKIPYNKLIISKSPNKADECKENNIDLMVDDRANQCNLMVENGVKCILMLTKYNKNEAGDLPTTSNWKSLYRKIKQWKK